MISQEQLSHVQDYLLQKLSTVSQKSLEESTLRLLNTVSPRLPERVRLPFLCVAFFGVLHLYLAVVLLFTVGLFIRRQFNHRLSPRLQQLSWFNPACQRVHLWLLIAYHGLLSLILMPSVEISPPTEEELIEGLDEKMEDYEEVAKEMAEEENREESDDLKTEDMFEGIDDVDMSTLIEVLDEAFLLDADSDLTMRESIVSGQHPEPATGKTTNRLSSIRGVRPVSLSGRLAAIFNTMRWFILLLLIFSPSAEGQKVGPPGPITSHFLDWLISHGYEADAFDRPDVGPNGSFGGKQKATDQVNNEPVIFIHGNGDAALHTQAPLATGWSRSIQYFLEQNYTSAELYATTWGDAWGSGSILDSYSTMHTCGNLLYLRRFLEAVISYTGAKKIDIIAHSVGVVLARKAVKGGDLIGTDGNCTLGPPLTNNVDTFVGIAGPNYGLCVCQLAQTVPAWCNALDGLYPGYTCQDQLLCGYTGGNCKQENYSALLEKINNDPTREGSHVYSMWSDVDEVLLFRGMTWGKPTSRIPGMNGRWISDRNGHVAMKDLTELRQYEAVAHHSI